jgi:hypothetical protein
VRHLPRRLRDSGLHLHRRYVGRIHCFPSLSLRIHYGRIDFT